MRRDCERLRAYVKKYLVRKSTSYPTNALPAAYTLVKVTPKGWKLTSANGYTSVYLAEKYCLFDTLEQAKAYARRVAVDNIQSLKAQVDKWQAVLNELHPSAKEAV